MGLAIILSSLSLCALSDHEAMQKFDALDAPNKAIASAISTTDTSTGTEVVSSTVHSQASLAISALKAMHSCEEQRRALHLTHACEIRAINDTHIQTGKNILAQVPKGKHPIFLWRLESSTSKVYLAGSIHVLKQTLLPLPRQYTSAFEISNHIVIEADTESTTPQAMQKLAKKYLLLPDRQKLQDVLSEAQFAILIDFLNTQNISLESVEKLKPAVLGIQLAVDRLTAMGYLPDYGVEKIFTSQIGNRKLLYMETLEQQLKVISSPPMTLQKELLIDTLQQMPEISQTMADLVTAWLSGDQTRFDDITQSMAIDSPEYIKFTKQLLDERNVGMTNKIDNYLKSEGTYFVMVGSAHLIGEQSILALLGQRGYTATQLHSTDSI